MTVVSLTDEGIHAQRLRDAGVEVVALGMGSALSFPRVLWQLRRLLKARRPDLLQTWMYHADLLGGLAGHITGIPVVWGIRLADISEHTKLLTRLVSRLCALLSATLPAGAVACGFRADDLPPLSRTTRS